MDTPGKLGELPPKLAGTVGRGTPQRSVTDGASFLRQPDEERKPVPLGQDGARVSQPVGTDPVEHDPGANPWQRSAGEHAVGTLEAAPIGSDHPDQPVGRRDQLPLQPAGRVSDIGDDRRVVTPCHLRQPAAVEGVVGTAEVEAGKAGTCGDGCAGDGRICDRAQSGKWRWCGAPSKVERGAERPVLGVGVDEQRLEAGFGQPPRESERDEAAAWAALCGRHHDETRAGQLPTTARACSAEVIGAAPAGGAGAAVSTAASRRAPEA